MKVIVYDSIEKKNLVKQEESTISSKEALIRTLDLMDLYARFNANQRPTKDDGIPWIILKIKN